MEAETPLWVTLLVAGVTTVIAVVALYQGYRANTHAGKEASAAEASAAESARSADAAERAAEVAERSELRTTERNDVHWGYGFGDGYEWEVNNVGLDDALDVTVIVLVGDGTSDERHVRTAETLAYGQGLSVDLGEIARAKLRRDVEAYEALMRVPGVIAVPPTSTLNIVVRVLWRTPAGTPRTEWMDAGEVELT